jgi:hypothetical protein
VSAVKAWHATKEATRLLLLTQLRILWRRSTLGGGGKKKRTNCIIQKKVWEKDYTSNMLMFSRRAPQAFPQ